MQQIPNINAELASQCMMHWLVSIPPQQSKACRLPVLKGTGTLLAAPAAQAGLAAAETQQPMRTRPTAWVRERGAAAMRTVVVSLWLKSKLCVQYHCGSQIQQSWELHRRSSPWMELETRGCERGGTQPYRSSQLRQGTAQRPPWSGRATWVCAIMARGEGPSARSLPC